ncbi:MAG: hypothetical protein KJ666_18370 [Bacteroidetes bacterium]|nr:hypothetical protein [Bacteroidota bacterium]MBU2586427.1 hypothetical protein [Bacteroidota bacterium]
MANRYIHEIVDFICFGSAYPRVHTEKDAAWKTLGLEHRTKNHELYNLYGEEWNFEDIYPKKLQSFFEAIQRKHGAKAEEFQVWFAHDILDKVWDGLSFSKRKYWESFLIWVIYSPRILKDWAGVDVINGRLLRVVEDQKTWKASPEIKFEYERLCRYVEIVKSNDEILQDMLERFGEKEHASDFG